MMATSWESAMTGGVLIGISVSLMLYWNGRVTGISGIVNGILEPQKYDTQWRLFFVAGLLLGGTVLQIIRPDVFHDELQSTLPLTVIAGLLVGFGTILGSGCTSGHGVCGISRLSPRSLVATAVFMLAGILTVTLFRYLGVMA